MMTLRSFYLLGVLTSLLLVCACPCHATYAGGAACKLPAETASGDSADQDLPPGQARVVIPVEGMTCGGCAVAIKMAVRKLDGVVDAEADHKKGTATVIYEKDTVTVEKIVEAINKTGFKASLPKEDAS